VTKHRHFPKETFTMTMLPTRWQDAGTPGPDAPDAILGPDLLLVPGESGDLGLYTPEGRSLGAFTDVLDAWAAIDAIDRPDFEELRPAA
jgi:hypothetical protein